MIETQKNPFKVQQLQAENSALKKVLVQKDQQLQQAHQQIEWFKEQFKLIRQRQFGKRSETSQTLNLTLFDEQVSDEVTETVEPIDEEREEVTYSRRKPKRGRNIDTSKCPRERRIHDLPEHEKMCDCGHALEKMGEDISEQLNYIPAVIEHVRLKYTCRHCETARSAPKPEQALPKSLASNTLIAEVIIKKYDHHLPLYRQSKIWLQEGLDIPDNTLGNWVMGAADVLAPLGDALWRQLPSVRLLQADETPVKILKPDKKGYLWGYNSLDPGNRFIRFEFSLSRGGEIPNHRLQQFHGILQTDGYSGYNAFRAHPSIVNLGCWDHARRKVTDVIKVNNHNETGLAGKLLKPINQLYKLERQCKQASIEERYATRQEKAKPLLEKIFCLVRQASVLPKSTLGTAITYLHNNEPYLKKYIDYGDTQMSNCLMENQIRPFAIGRKNWLFVGNEVSANKAALLYSLIQSCKINRINPRQYLIAVLDKVHAMRRREIDPATLLPQFIDNDLLKANP